MGNAEHRARILSQIPKKEADTPEIDEVDDIEIESLEEESDELATIE